jgi:ATP-dependent DNA ligase
VELGSRNEKPLTRYFPELVDALRRELPERCVLDGEIVIAGPHGLEFDALSQRIHPAEKRIRLLAESTPASFVAFDLLAEGDRSLLRGAPYANGAARWRRRSRKAAPDPRHAGHRRPRRGGGLVLPLRGRRARRRRGQGRGAHLSARQAGDGQGQARAHRRLRGGGLPHAQGRRVVGSLLLGLFDEDGTLHHVGVASGFSVARRRELVTELEPFRKAAHPWDTPGRAGPADGGAGARRWEPLERRQGHDLGAAAPRTVCEVSYDHLQQDRFRHATSFVAGVPTVTPRRAPTTS